MPNIITKIMNASKETKLYWSLVAIFILIINITPFVMKTDIFVKGLAIGTVLQPILMLIGDISSEFFGKEKTRKATYIAVGFRFIEWGALVVLATLFGGIFSKALVIVSTAIIALSLSTLLTQYVDTAIYDWLGKRHGDKYLAVRKTASTLVSQAAGTLLTVSILFYGDISMIITAFVARYAFKAICAFAYNGIFYPVVVGLKKLGFKSYYSKEV